MVSFFNWLNEYSISNEIIDKQHRYFFDLVNEIINPYNDQQKTYHNFLALYHYTRYHFRDEEDLMQRYQYPGYDEHIKEHNELTTMLDEISAGINNEETKSAEVTDFISRWLLDHVLGKDILLGEFLRQQIAITSHDNQTTTITSAN